MRVRKNVILAAIVAAAMMSGSRAARAQGSTGATPASPPAKAAVSAGGSAAKAPRKASRDGGSAPRPASLPVEGPAREASTLPAGASLVAGDRLFAPPAVLGEAWARALRAVLDGMKHLVDVERADRAIGGPIVAAYAAPPRRVPAWRDAWMPANALREALAASPVQVTPVAIAPPTEAVVDTRGEHAVLLGARMALPWMVP